MTLNKFIPLTKMEELSDGTLHVYGTVTAEQPDMEKEVCDYAGTKPLYEQRTQEQVAKTSLPGMTPSLMPFREMHDTKVQGAGRILVCDDAAKTIKMGFHVVSSEAVRMWKAGCFVGFSQGGSYVKRWPDPEFEGCTRYIADPLEVSAVDSPCLPIALVESMKGRTVTFTKSNGVTEEIPLEIKPFDTHLMTKMDRFIDLLTKREEIQPSPKAAHDTISSNPTGDIDMAKITDQASLTKAAKTIADHLEKHHEMHKAHHEKLEALLSKDHPIVKSSQSMMDHCEKCMKAAKDAGEGEEPEEAEKVVPVDIAKALEPILAELVAIKAESADLKKKLSEIPAPIAAHTGIVAEPNKAHEIAELEGLLKY